MIYSLSRGMKPMSSEGKNDLELGRVLLLNGYECPTYIIVKNLGADPRCASYGSRYLCVNPVNGVEIVKEAYALEFLKDKKDDRIQTYITDEKIDLDAVLDVWQKAQAAKLIAEAELQKKKDAREAGEKMLPVMFPELKKWVGSGKSRAAIGAGNLKKELAKAFPGIKFSVSSEQYAGGNSIDVDWTDGPTTEQVKKISDRYQECDFDGMTDSTTFRDQIFTETFGGAKYVMEQRCYSDEAYNKVAADLGFPDARMNRQRGRMEGVTYEQDEMIKRETWKRAF